MAAPSENKIDLRTVDVLLCVATEVELAAVLDAAGDAADAVKYMVGPKRTYFHLGSIEGAEIALALCEMGGATVGGAITTLGAAFNDLNPQFVIQVGIAFGMDETRQPIGHVLVSSAIAPYEPGRVSTTEQGEAEVERRGTPALVSPVLRGRMRTVAAVEGDLSVEFGLMLSGEKLIDNVDYRDSLRKDWPKAIGGDMEGAGMYAAAMEHQVACCVVKAVCDYADGKKREDKKRRQRIAAKAAVDFVFRTLRVGGFERPPIEAPPQTQAPQPDATTDDIRSRLDEVLVPVPNGIDSEDALMNNQHELLENFLALSDDRRRGILVEIGVVTWEEARVLSGPDDWITALRTVMERDLTDSLRTATRLRSVRGRAPGA